LVINFLIAVSFVDVEHLTFRDFDVSTNNAFRQHRETMKMEPRFFANGDYLDETEAMSIKLP